MKKGSFKIVCIFLALVMCLCACGAQDDKAADTDIPALIGCSIEHEPEFGGIDTRLSIEEFDAPGFEYGDSVDITFSNGFEVKDVPYYSGYYTKKGEPLVVGYPGYTVCVRFNNGADLWETAGLEDTDTMDITLNSAGKYIKTQEARYLNYSDNRDDYASDEVFANFREATAGGLKNVYRSASPTDNIRGRAPYVENLAEEVGIKFILDLADDEDKVEKERENYDFNAEFFMDLLEQGKVALLGLNADYASQEFKDKLASGLRTMSEAEGPYLIHCTEGKDRTGFVCLLLEALVGASYDEIETDYMITYDNYYGITKESDPEKYDIIINDILNPVISDMAGDEDFDKDKLQDYAEQYLLSGSLSEEEIEQLRNVLK